MGRPPKFPRDVIIRAAEALAAEGEEVGPFRVQQRLGGGRLDRIESILKSWRRDRLQRPHAGAGCPASVTNAAKAAAEKAAALVTDALADVWSEALKAARAEVADEHAQLQRRLEGLEQEIERAVAAVTQAERAAEQAQQAAIEAHQAREAALRTAAEDAATAEPCRQAAERTYHLHADEAEARRAAERALRKEQQRAATADKVAQQAGDKRDAALAALRSTQDRADAAEVAAREAQAHLREEAAARADADAHARQTVALMNARIEKLLTHLPAASAESGVDPEAPDAP
ncbi:DNA-binding protein [Caenispirillum salinarum]|uniref:DNA-binding protein n=1 Tax=Caenispirillum salinarum TaxID=859058 RepID=UPI000A051804|nr:DNA-binding protein [Caenispirillum salinarum]